MCKTITFEELLKRNFNTTGISNYELTCDKCLKCHKSFKYRQVKKFMRNRINKDKDVWQTCPKCFLKLNTSENLIWIEKNRAAQLIAQNTDAQKRKNAIGVSKSWTKERRIKASIFTKNKWKNDIEFRKKALNNISWNKNIETYNEHYKKMLKKSIGSGGLKGVYNDIYYDSALELSFIMWCNQNLILIKRFDLEPILYKDENGISRLYYPDFIINNDTIIEIKGLGLYYFHNYNRNILKIEAAKKHKLNYQVILSNDKILKQNYNIARRWHHQNKK